MRCGLRTIQRRRTAPLLILSKLNDFSIEQAQFVTMEQASRIIISMATSNCFEKFDVKSDAIVFYEGCHRFSVRICGFTIIRR